MDVLIFEDAGVESLAPLTLTRPAYSLSIGGASLSDRVATISGNYGVRVRPHVEHLPSVGERLFPATVRQTTLAVNARLVPSNDNLAILRRLSSDDCPKVVLDGEDLLAAVIPSGEILPSVLDAASIKCLLPNASDVCQCNSENKLKTVNLPHEVVREHLATFQTNLESKLNYGRDNGNGNHSQIHEIQDGVFVDGEANIDASVRFDTCNGPILIGHGVCIGPFCYLRGPVSIGANSCIREHSSIKDQVSIGNHCKVGGEIAESTFESYSNKQHHGFIGHSYIGSWVNLGAGTSNSDLKNTYGEIRINIQGRKTPTGMQFLGCMIGDYTKSAINTAIFTGKTIGVCSMLYGFVTTDVPSFTNYARTFDQVTDLPVNVIIDMQKRMFSRRGIEQTDGDIKVLEHVYESVSHDRELVKSPLTL